MQNNNIIPPNRKDSKLSKIFNLKLIGTPSSLDNNLIESNNKTLTFGTTRSLAIKQNISNSIEKNINNEKKEAIPIKNNDDEKNKNLINNKSICNTIENIIYYQSKRKYYSHSKFSSNDNVLKLDSSKNNCQSYKNKNSRLKYRSQTIISTNNSSLYTTNLFPKITANKNNNKDNKKLYIINNNINNKINHYATKSKSGKHFSYIYSITPNLISGINSKNNVLIRKKKFKGITYRSINKKNINNFTFSKSNIIDLKNFSFLLKNMRKYPFVVNPKPITITKFTDLPLTVRNTNTKYVNILKRENGKLFSHYFSIIKKEKFSKKYQNISNMYGIKDTKGKKEKKECYKNEEDINSEEESIDSDSLINNKIISGRKLLNEIKYNIKKNVPKKVNKKLLYYKFKRFMLLLNSKLDMMSVYLEEIIKYYKVPKFSYGFSATHELLFSIRTKNLKMVNSLLDKYKYLVLDYDYFSMTALHWAAKYNFYQIIPRLVGYGSNVNAQNYIGETPLLIGVKRKFIESVVFLLIYIASPFIKDNKGFGILDYSKSEYRMKIIFKKIISLHYQSIFGPTKNIYEYIQSKFIEYIVDENKNDLEPEAFNMINERLEYYQRIKNSK